jgi:hypothetical protein
MNLSPLNTISSETSSVAASEVTLPTPLFLSSSSSSSMGVIVSVPHGTPIVPEYYREQHKLVCQDDKGSQTILKKTCKAAST